MLKTYAGLVAGAALMVGATSAQANDWNGAYAGVGVGSGAVVHDLEIGIPAAPGSIGFDGIGGEGFLATLIAGYDHVINGKYVVGGFAEYDFSNLETDIDIAFPGFGFSFDIEQERAWALGVRAGMLVSPETLWYGTVGYTQVTFDTPALPIPVTLNIDEFSGYFVGVGVESQIMNNVSIRGEYRYTQLEDETIFAIPGLVDVDLEPSMHTGRLIVSYKFSRPEPAVEVLK